MKQITDLKVGDPVWWVDANRSGVFEGRVTRVGRTLIDVRSAKESGRFSMVFRRDTGRRNDDFGHQTLIADVEEHKDRIAAATLWSMMRREWQLPAGVKHAHVIAAATLLKFKGNG